MSFDPQVFDQELFGSQGLLGGGCLFDPAIFDAAVFDVCGVAPAVEEIEQAGGGGARSKNRRVRKRYRSLEPHEHEVIVALAAEQIAEPAIEEERIAQLERALGPITMQAEHLAALAAERERLVGIEVGKYLRRLQEMEDESLLMAIAEAL